MPTPAIRVENLGKCYRLGATHSQTLGALLSSAAGRLFGRRNGHAPASKLTGNGPSQMDEEGNFWALKDVSFDVQPGEVVGIIGRNGAGKSTLLKILSNIVSPTTGHVELHGRVASLLEVGTGFHPELTGRENVHLNGAILGMSKAEVRHKFDEIVAFAEIDQFIDTPVKRYSSGMYVRLAFAVAAHLDPEILIIDEVLAVGDIAFQRKCLGKIRGVAGNGRTVLFVSHNLAAIRALCGRTAFLEAGRLTRIGSTSEVIASYQSSNNEGLIRSNHLAWTSVTAPGNSRLKVLGVDISPLQGEILDVESGFTIHLRIECFEPISNLDATIELRTPDDVVVLHDGLVFTSTDDCRAGIYEIQFGIPGNLLNTGEYRLNLIFGQNQRFLVTRVDGIIEFEIAHVASRMLTPRPGIVRPQIRFECHYFAGDTRELVEEKSL